MRKFYASISILGTILATALLLSWHINQPPATAAENNFNGRTKIRWFFGLEFGSDFNDIALLDEIVADFNQSQDDIYLVVEVASIAGAYDMFATEIATESGPDLVGPISWGMAAGFPGQWLNLDPYLSESDINTGRYEPVILSAYKPSQGELLSVPFGISPSVIYYDPLMFDEAGLTHPPQVYGQSYVLDGRDVVWNWATVATVARRLTVDVDNHPADHPQFNHDRIAQVGFHFPGRNMMSLASYFGPAQIYEIGADGSYRSAIPAEWRYGWQWWHDGLWGPQPYLAPTPLADSVEFGNGNLFGAGKAAMSLGRASDLCCLAQAGRGRQEFQLAILPQAPNGQIYGQISELSFYVWQGTQHPEEALTVLQFLLGEDGEPLLSSFHMLPAATDRQSHFMEKLSRRYPSVTKASWQALVQGLNYPDRPSANQYLPNRNQAFDRIQIFGDTLATNKEADLQNQFQLLQNDLTEIYNR